MKERPILFSAPMVRAILEGRKTQTRRVLKPQPDLVPEWNEESSVAEFFIEDKCVHKRHCPYGQPGDRLWVREAWKHIEGGAVYDAAGGVADGFDPETIYRASRPHYPGPWKPSIYMPRWASRIMLEVVSVRVERLRDISEADAKAEGVTYEPMIHSGYVGAFCDLWSSINGRESWDDNPWVWAVEFRRVTP